MVSDNRCNKCFLRTYQRLFEKFNIHETHRKRFLSEFHDIVERDSELSSPEIQRNLSKCFCELVGIVDPFRYEKFQSNLLSLQFFDVWKPKVIDSVNPFELALRLSIAGNIMDYGASDNFAIEQTIQKVLHTNFAINHTLPLQKEIEKAQQILFLGDNAGEIVFDKLFIETVLPKKIVFVVKSAPILNDVTLDDAQQVKID